MSTVFHLPDVGEGLTEAEIISWKVAVGEEVKVNQVLVEIETAKSLVELPSPEAGVIGALLVDEGSTVEVGTPIVQYGLGDAPVAPPEAATAKPAASEESGATLVGYGVRETSAARRPRKGRGATPATPEPAEPPAASDDPPGRPLARPPVRKLARDLGVDLAALRPSGIRGEVTREDVRAAVVTPAAEPETGAAPERQTIVALKGVRKATAQAMVQSAFTVPHVTEFLEVDATATMEFVARAKATELLGPGVRVNPMLIVARAVCWAAARHPEMNASFGEDHIVLKHYVNLGVAAATPRGLIVPNIKDAHAMGLAELSGALGDLVATARTGKTPPGDQAGGTITITNVGVFGIDSGTPIINRGEAAIVAFGQIRPKPWVVDGEVVPRQVTTLAVSADHRVVDGEVISKFLADLGRALEDPMSMLA